MVEFPHEYTHVIGQTQQSSRYSRKYCIEDTTQRA